MSLLRKKKTVNSSQTTEIVLLYLIPTWLKTVAYKTDKEDLSANECTKQTFKAVCLRVLEVWWAQFIARRKVSKNNF